MTSLIRALGGDLSNQRSTRENSAPSAPAIPQPAYTESALQSTLLRNVLDILPVGVWLIDSAGIIIYGNPAGQEIWGGARYVGIDAYDEYKGWWTGTGRRIAPEEWAAARAVSNGETSIDEEIDIECFDGARKHVLHSTVPIFGVAGEILGAVVVIQDVTERSSAQAALQKREAELKEVQRIGVVGSWTMQLSGRLTWSEEACIICGVPPDQFATTVESLLDRVHPIDLEIVRKWVLDWLVVDPPNEIAFRVVRPDGSVRTLRGRSALVRGDGGSPLYVAGTLQDVTERQGIEVERERLLAALDQAGEVVFTTSADGTIEYVNAAFELVTGYSRVEAIGQNPRFLNSGKQDDDFYKELWEKINSGQPWRGRMVNRRKSGTLFVQDATIAPTLDACGHVVNFVAVARDVTEQLQVTECVTASQKLEAIGTLAGGVAHDFNNLLSVILGYSRSATSKLRSTDPLRADIEEVTHAGERAATLTRQLLAFSRKQVLEPRLIQCNAAIENLATMLRRLIGENIEFALRLHPNLGTAFIDPGQFEQVIINLVVNARDAMPFGGTLAIETSEVSAEPDYANSELQTTTGACVQVAVIDSGCGMDEQTLQRMFDPFFTTKSKDKGTGLGLSTVYGIMKQSGGSVRAESTLGQGTKMVLLLPRRSSLARSCASPSSAPPSIGGTETILVVEDEEAVRRSIVRQLGAAGYCVLAAANGLKAMQLDESQLAKIDLLLTDVIMPQMGGVQLAERLRVSHPNLHVLFMSGYPDDAFSQGSEPRERPNSINKPFAANELENKIRLILDEERAATSVEIDVKE